MGRGESTKRALDALDAVKTGLEVLRQSIVEAFVVPEPPPPVPEPVRLAPVPTGPVLVDGPPIHGFHVRLSEGEMENLRRLANLDASSQQRIARQAIREHCERRLKQTKGPR